MVVWSPRGGARAGSVPLLVVHDGPEYSRRASLRRLLEPFQPLRVALLHSNDRNEHYSASARYARTLAEEILPELGPASRRVGLGCSLGGLALIHAHRRYPDAFDAIVAQSPSLFRRRTDRQEAGFPRFARIARFVGTLLNTEAWHSPIPVTITCGVDEENLANNRAAAGALERQGYPLRFHEVPGGHDWRSWRRALDLYLPEVLA
ncbi:MAG: alpha/beta hydrolase [Pseudomonadota bacterium]